MVKEGGYEGSADNEEQCNVNSIIVAEVGEVAKWHVVR